MGLVLGLGLIGLFAGGGLALVCFEEARRLRRLRHRLSAICFGLAAFCAVVALGGAWLAWEIIGGFIL